MASPHGHPRGFCPPPPPSRKHSHPLTRMEGEGHGEGLEEVLWESAESWPGNWGCSGAAWGACGEAAAREGWFLGGATRGGSCEDGVHCHSDNRAPGVLRAPAVVPRDVPLETFLT